MTAPLNIVLPDDGTDISQLHWGWRVCHPDLSSSRGFRWPFPGNWVEADGDCTTGGACPSKPGDGICVARTWAGAASGGIPAATCLLVAWLDEDVLGGGGDKVRVSRAWVAEMFDMHRGIGPLANLRGADLYGANLRDADLYLADLYGANLYGANPYGADLSGANLYGANLYGANLYGANLSGAWVSPDVSWLPEGWRRGGNGRVERVAS